MFNFWIKDSMKNMDILYIILNIIALIRPLLFNENRFKA